MSEGEPNLEENKDNKISRRQALGGIAGLALNALASNIFARVPESPLEEYPKERKWIQTPDSLPKGPDDVYIFLFERNPYNVSKSDDFIAEAGELTGNKIGKHWHVEVVYFNHEKQKWMAMGCRPPRCEKDFPLDELQRQMTGYIVNIQHVKMPVGNQLKARKWFENVLQGQPYSLAGPPETNCTDAALGLGKAAGTKDAGAIQHVTLDELKQSPRTTAFLSKWKLNSVGDVMKRKDIVFPDEFIKIGEYVGSMHFSVD